MYEKKIKEFTRIILIALAVIGVFAVKYNNVEAANSFKSNFKKSQVTVKYVRNNEDGIKIKWKKISHSSGYIIYRRDNNGKWEEYDRIGRKNSYIDEDTETGIQYQYAVKAYTFYRGKIIYSKLSRSEIKIIGIPHRVENVYAEYIGNTNVSLNWEENSEASGYYLYRQIGNDSWEKIATIDDPETIKYKDNIVETGKSYKYKVIPFEIIDSVEYVGFEDVMPSMAYSDSGIDVSYHNGKISWKKVKQSGIDFAFIRAGYGNPSKKSGGVVDSQFARNVKYARKNGIAIGVYFYSCSRSVAQSKKEAKFVVKLLKKYGEFEYPIVYDFESSYRRGYKYKSQNTKMIKAFCDIIEEAGYDAMVYSDYDMLTRYVNYDKISKYGVWVAYWTFDPKRYPAKLDNVQIWQYSDKGRINGIKYAVDKNVRFICR